MTEFTKVDARPEGKIKRDRWGRYVLPHPETGKEQSWQRATTVAAKLADRYGLERWSQFNIAYGIGQRPDLFARLAACKRDDLDTLGEVVRRAEEAAASQSGAILGSAVHQFAERVDLGEELEIPPPYDRDVKAYAEAMRESGIVVDPKWTEVIVCLPEAGVAGTVDRIVTHPDWPEPRIADLKTAADGVRANGSPYNKILEYGGADIPLQLAIYAHASYWWDGSEWRPMPDLNLTTGIIAHVPVGQGECRLYGVDLEAGWKAVQLAVDVEAWRKRKGVIYDLGSTTAPPEPEPAPEEPPVQPHPPDPELFAYAERCVGIIKEHPDARAELAELWSTSDIPTFRHGGPRNAAELDEVYRMLEVVNLVELPSLPGDFDNPGETDEPAAEVDEPPRPTRLEWAQGRVETIKAHPEARALLAGLWSNRPDIPTFAKGGPQTAADLETVLGYCALVEMQHGLPFPDEELPF